MDQDKSKKKDEGKKEDEGVKAPDKMSKAEYSKWLETQENLPESVRDALAEFDPESGGGFKTAVERERKATKEAGEKAKAAAAELAKLKSDRDDQDSATLAEQQKFEELSEKLQKQLAESEEKLVALTAQNETLTAKEKADEETATAYLAQLKLDLEIAPIYETLLAQMTVQEQLKWIIENKETIATDAKASTKIPKSPDEKAKLDKKEEADREKETFHVPGKSWG